MRSNSDSIFHDMAEEELSHPSDRKISGSRVVYQAKNKSLSLFAHNFEHGVLSDFGEARPGDTIIPHTEIIQPYLYRAPEVILRMPYSYPVDIWNAGVMVGV